MLDNKELIIIEKKFSYLNLILSGLLILYYMMFWWFHKLNLAPNKVLFSLFLIVIGIDFIFGKLNYLNKESVIKFIRFLELLSVSVLPVSESDFVWNFFIEGFAYFLISIEMMMLYDITELYSRVDLLMINFIPVGISLLIDAFLGKAENFYFFVYLCIILILIVCEVSCYIGLSDLFKKLYEKIANLNNIASTNREQNDELKTAQSRLVTINEQLSMQRFKLENANKEIMRRNEETQLLNNITNNVAKYFEIDKMVEEIGKNIYDYLHCDFSYILVIEKKENEYNILAHSLIYKETSRITDENIKLFEQKYFVDEFINIKKMEIDEYANVKLEYFRGSAIKSAIIYVNNISENQYGIFVLGKNDEKWIKNKQLFFSNLFGQITLAFKNVILYSKMHNMAIKDALTGIYNRQYFNGIIEELAAKFINTDRVLTAVLFDIDKFKRINDAYGHISGDEVISYCGHMAEKYTRDYNAFAVRYGGEEFVMIFPDRETKEVLAICSEMHKEIRNRVFNFNENKVKINISVGIASYPKNCNNPAELINLADLAMYFSKENGRGRITVYIDEISSN